MTNSATTATDNVVVKYQEPVQFQTDQTGSNDFNLGDLLYMDTSAHQAKPLINSDTNAATFCGIAMNGSFVNVYGTKKYFDLVPVLTKGIVRLFTTVGDTYHDGDTVYVGADAQTITNTVGGLTKKLGYVKLAAGITSLAGAAGVTVEIQITPLWPVTSV